MRKNRTRKGAPPQKNEKRQAEFRKRNEEGLRKRQEMRELRELDRAVKAEVLDIQDAND